MGRAEVAPGVPARTAHYHFEAAAAQGLGHYGVSSSAIDYHAVGNRVTPARRRENVSHSAQVAIAFLTDVSDEHKGQRMRNSRAPEHTGHGQHGRNARAVVGDSRTIQSAALLPHVQRRRRGEHGINIRADTHETTSEARTHAEHIPHPLPLPAAPAKPPHTP